MLHFLATLFIPSDAARRAARWFLASGLLLAPAAMTYAATPTVVVGEPVTIRIEINDRAELQELTHLVSIENVRGSEVWAIATPRQLDSLRAAGFEWQVELPAKLVPITMCPEGWESFAGRDWSCYPSYTQYTLIMQSFAADHPNICRLVDLGTGNNTVRPHHLWALVISDNVDLDEDEPEVLLTSSMHGNETTGFVLLLRLIDELLTGYGSDPEIDALVDETEIWINPLANPDGAYFGSDEDIAGATRYFTTTSGGSTFVDPNRNFPDPADGALSDDQAWWPETEAMMALAEARTFVLSANFHGGFEVVNYPWDTWERRHPDDAWFRDLARAYADLAQSDSPGGYMTDRENGVTNGWDWYQTAGGRQDFMTFFHGGREVTIELSATKLLPAEELEDHWQWNRRALLDFMAHAHEGIRGLVTNRDGWPLAAAIEVVGHDTAADASVVRTDPAVGDYHRLLLPGTYDLRFTAPGCHPFEIFGIAVPDGAATTVDVVLDCGLLRRPTGRATPNRSHDGEQAQSYQQLSPGQAAPAPILCAGEKNPEEHTAHDRRRAETNHPRPRRDRRAL
ncbi:MAG: M14 family zinc carboxypeptidase [Thermoanaerobaculales bacterium]